MNTSHFPGFEPDATPTRVRPVRATLVSLLSVLMALPAHATTPLADEPLFADKTVPGNLALALSVEYPTAIRAAHTSGYVASQTFLGYFDPGKCYTYNNATADADKYFIPAGNSPVVANVSTHICTGKWSGNFLNWATMQTIDPFRWALTGGYRVRDEVGLTVLERAWQSDQDDRLSPNKQISDATVTGATPFTGGTMNIRVQNLGNKFRFTVANAFGDPIPYNNASSGRDTFEAFVRVKVCDPSAAAGGVESNCKQYGNNWKPEGLIQQYANRLRFSAFGYMNQQDGNNRDGGVLRAKQKFVGPTRPVPGEAAVANGAAEWSPTTGIFVLNPDAADATSTNTLFRPSVDVANSGVMNYLNKFGQITPGKYRSNDPVSELYYAAIRYFRNLGNVPEWTSVDNLSRATITTRLDGFPVITAWDDPIQYACQKNFILGIGDVYTHADRNVAGNTNAYSEGHGLPASIASDTAFDAEVSTAKVGRIQGINGLDQLTTGRSNGFLMAGLAYQANTTDIRSDIAGRQSIQTYWVDVLEAAFEKDNQFYLAAKFGGYPLPTLNDANFATYFATNTAVTGWSTTGDKVGVAGSTQQDRPDNYYTAGRPDQMVSGLTAAFKKIASSMSGNSSTLALPAPQVEALGTFSYASTYSATNWTGDVKAYKTVFNSETGVTTSTELWSFAAKLSGQANGADGTGTGWNTNRRIVTWDPVSRSGRAFRSGDTTRGLTTAQLTALNTTFRDGDDSAEFVNYIRGDRSHETTAAAAENRFYRTRTALVGDIVGSKARPVGPPTLPLSPTANPGYAAFKAQHASRPTVVYAGSNDGMLHAVKAATAASAADEGTELFAYVPNALLNGPTATKADNGLEALGDPSYVHRYFVNAVPTGFDVDFHHTRGATGDNPDWRSVLIGGLGKGGKAYYALDITTAPTSEADMASKVLWEFTHADLGYSYGEAALIKTAKYGWVVILPSGYNNTDGQGYFFFVNPRTGELLEKVGTGVGSPTASAGMAHVNTFVNDRTDGTADAAYGVDLLGNVWRVDLTTTTGNYAPATLLANVTDGTTRNGVAQPITSRPRIEVQTRTNKRFVLFGTGRMLEDGDIGSTQMQSFYAINDGRATAFNTTAADLPIRRSALTETTNLITGQTATPENWLGWYIDLGRDTSGLSWRITSEPAIFEEITAFASTVPSGDPCNRTGNSRLYAVDYGTSKNVLQGVTAAAPYASYNGFVTDTQFLSVSGKLRLSACLDNGDCKSPGIDPPANNALRVLNWRELKVAN